MSTTTSATDARRSAYDPRTSARHTPILVATDGSPSADVALAAAQLLAERSHLPVKVVSVVDPLPVVLSTPDLVAPPVDPDVLRVQLRTDQVINQVRRTMGLQAEWPVEVRLGRPAAELAQSAKHEQAELIITGLNRHGAIDRLLGNETPLRTAQISDTPLLATARSFVSLPREVLIAVDLEAPGIDRLRDAPVLKALISDAKSVYFMHVVPDTETWGPDGVYWNHYYGKAVHDAFAYVKEVLQLPSHVHVQLLTPSGTAAEQILDFAVFAKIDLIIAGRRQTNALRRHLVGGVAGKLLRNAGCSVLLLPQRETFAGVDPLTRRYSSTETLIDPDRWAERLATFSRRNATRSAALEIDDSGVGAQVQAVAYPLAGVDYDHHDNAITIRLGGTTGNHMSHSVRAPRSVDILIATDGMECALRVGYKDGQAILTFT